MQGLLFPIIMLTVTLVGGGLLLLFLKTAKKRPVSDEATMAMQTAQQFINVRDVKDKYLYTKDGLVLTYLRVHDPVELSNWSVANGHRCEGNGSYHSLIPAAAQAYGLSCEGDLSAQDIVDALSSGKLVVAIMSKGHFTSSGHFIVLRGVTSEGKILVADPASHKRSQQEWDLSLIMNEARKGAAAGGPFWAVSN